jgi:Beta-lactamase enzyme family
MKYKFLMVAVILTCLCWLAFSHSSGHIMQQADYPRTDSFLADLLENNMPDSFRYVLHHPDEYKVQIIYTQINRDAHNRPHFKNYYFNVDPYHYYYPASTVKLPIVLSALEKLNNLHVSGLTIYTPMYTDSVYPGTPAVTEDTTAANGKPSIAQYIRRIFLISDNHAANRLYEWNGQQELNSSIHSKGYIQTDILQRLNIELSEDQNRHTNPVIFKNGDSIIYVQAGRYNTAPYPDRHDSLGNGYYDDNGQLVMHAMNFSGKNRFPIQDLQQVLQSVIFPFSVPGKERFDITPDQRRLMLQYMSEYPGESAHPSYDTSEYYESFGKFFWWGDRNHIPSSIRIFNKPGWAWGFLIDGSYIVDFSKHIEFMLCAVIYTNKDGILDNAHYQTETVGKPFMHALGKTIYDYECTRKRLHQPDLSAFRFDYH